MPKTKEQLEKIKDQRKESIVIASIKIFAFRSYENVTISNIAQTAKCSHGLFYHYYDSKEDVFHDAMDYTIKQVSKYLDQVVFDISKPYETLHGLITKLLELISSRDNLKTICLYLLLNIILQESSIPKPKSTNILEKEALNRLVYDLVKEGQQQGIFLMNDPREFTLCLMSLLKGISYNRLFVGPKNFLCPKTDTIMNMVVRK